jgi:hypothetical protein
MLFFFRILTYLNVCDALLIVIIEFDSEKGPPYCISLINPLILEFPKRIL